MPIVEPGRLDDDDRPLVQVEWYRITPLTAEGWGIVDVVPGRGSIHDVKLSASVTHDDRRRVHSPSKGDARYLSWLTEHVASIPQQYKTFLATFAGGSVFAWVTALKDRHNANVLVSEVTGAFVNIDFGFAFGQAPGGFFSMETEVFKVQQDLKIGLLQPSMPRVKTAILDAFRVAQRYRSGLEALLACLHPAKVGSNIKGIGRTKSAADGVAKRLMVPDRELGPLVDAAIEGSGGRKYDQYQLQSTAICI
ncbi:Phosphatidylinositol 4-kinase beta [Coelomomyces lativittatus]|nr:Phosphatidylinositol 4-kinase beta [Coelomomyces lativittatus]